MVYVSHPTEHASCRLCAADAMAGALQMPRMFIRVCAEYAIVMCISAECMSRDCLCRYTRAGFSFLAQVEDEDVLPDPSLVDDR